MTIFGSPPLLRVATLRGAAHELSQLPASAVLVRLAPPQPGNDELTAEEVLLGEPVGLMLTWHPAVSKLIELCGGVASGPAGYKIPRTKTTQTAWVEFISRVHPNIWVTPEGDELTAAEILTQTGIASSVPAPRVAGPRGSGRITFRATSRTIYLNLAANPVTVRDMELPVGKVVRVQLPEAGRIVRNLRAAKIAVVDADRPGHFDAAQWMWQRRLTVRALPNDLGAANVEVGEFVTAASTGNVSLAQAQKVVAGVRGGVQLAVEPLVASALTMLDATPVEGVADSLVLSPWQERFVAKFLAADGRGLVNVLPPGSGKTGCVLASFAHLSATDPTHTGLVVAPTSTLKQWEVEVPRFYPTGIPVTVTDSNDLTKLQSLPPHAVVLVGPKLVGEHPEVFKAAQFNSLAVDEGLYLAGASKAARALWDIRREINRAVILTGTPPTGSVLRYGKLLSFALNTSRDGRNVPASVKGYGPWVFGENEQIGNALPQSRFEHIRLSATHIEEAVQKVGTARVTDLLHKLQTSPAPGRLAPQLRTELRLWRLAAGIPVTALTSSSSFGKDLRTELGITTADTGTPAVTQALTNWGPGPKLEWLTQTITGALQAQEPTLVFTDSLTTVTALQHLLPQNAGIGFLTGQVPAKKRAELVADFTSGKLDVMVASGVGQLGVNLQRASRIIHADIPASHSDLTQRTGRALRMGSDHGVVEVLVPLLADSIEARLWELCSSETSHDVVSLAQLLTQTL